jgi:TATA-box binding protein (TBP) (component of TFIID and TFIIIB)
VAGDPPAHVCAVLRRDGPRGLRRATRMFDVCGHGCGAAVMTAPETMYGSPEKINRVEWQDCNLCLQNYVVTAATYNRANGPDSSYDIHLRKVAALTRFYGGEWDHKRFTSIRWQFRHPKVVVLYFSKGTLVCTGANSRASAEIAIVTLINILRKQLKLDIRIRGDSVRVRNVVFSGRLPYGYEIDLQAMLESDREKCQYSPERFPGLALRHPDTYPMTLLVFTTGSLIVTGTTNKEGARYVLSICLDIIQPFVRPKGTFTVQDPDSASETSGE